MTDTEGSIFNDGIVKLDVEAENNTPSSLEYDAVVEGIPVIEVEIGGATVIRAPVDSTLTIHGVAAEAHATGVVAKQLNALTERVLLREAQALTSAEQAQVRKNIGLNVGLTWGQLKDGLE
ncbi:MAG: hypothetical protein J6N19_03075 [Clostridium sp.]|nr:hypothetical protein [Clostridium sp.]